MSRSVLLDFDQTVNTGTHTDIVIGEHVRSMILALSRTDQLVWYSAREEEAAELGRRLMGVDASFVPLGTFPGTDVEAKLDGLTAWGFYDPQVQYLIVDDAPPPAAWLTPNMSVQVVDPQTGLTEEDCTLVLEWARG